MLSEVKLLEPALVLVIESKSLIDHPELLQEAGNLDQNDDGILLDVLHQILDENGGLTGLAFNLHKWKY